MFYFKNKHPVESLYILSILGVLSVSYYFYYIITIDISKICTMMLVGALYVLFIIFSKNTGEFVEYVFNFNFVSSELSMLIDERNKEFF